MSTTYLVFTSDDKLGTLHPDVVGPFSSEEEAEGFLKRHPHWESEPGVLLPAGGSGGYAGAVFVNERTADDPQVFLDQWKDWDDEGEDARQPRPAEPTEESP